MTTINSRDAIGACGVPQDKDGRELQRTLRESVSEALEVRRKGSGVHGMVLAIRDSLSRGDDADELATRIDTALDAASKALADKGYSQNEINAAVSRFRDRLVREIDGLGGGKSSDTVQRAAAVAVREVTRERFALDITTAEGDRVSIRFKSLNVTQVAAAQVSNGETTSTAAEASVISRGRFKVEVDGDLNDAERAAIGNLLDKVDDIAQDFFGGDVQAAFAAASRVGLESDALSAFSLRLSYSRSVAAQAYAKTAAIGAPATTPALSVPATTPAASTTPSQVADVSTPSPVVDSTTATPADAPAIVPATDAPSARQTIASFTKDVLARLSTGEHSAAKFTLRWKVEFLMTAIESVANTQVQQDATDALGQALDSAAA